MSNVLGGICVKKKHSDCFKFSCADLQVILVTWIWFMKQMCFCMGKHVFEDISKVIFKINLRLLSR